MSTIERLSEFTSDQLIDFSKVEEIADGAGRFARCGYLPLAGFLTSSGLRELRRAADGLALAASRKDFRMECMDSTPRHMSTVGGLTIAGRAPGIADLYHDAELRQHLSAAIGLPLVTADDPVERHVLNLLHQGGDTHGYHTDDYPIALVVFIESPTCDDGCGRLDFCAAADPTQAATASHRAGDAYLLRADALNHRVQPIHEGCRRTVLNFAYGIEGHEVVPTPSASLLYD